MIFLATKLKSDFRLVAKYFFWIIFYNLAPKLQYDMVQKTMQKNQQKGMTKKM